MMVWRSWKCKSKSMLDKRAQVRSPSLEYLFENFKIHKTKSNLTEAFSNN